MKKGVLKVKRVIFVILSFRAIEPYVKRPKQNFTLALHYMDLTTTRGVRTLCIPSSRAGYRTWCCKYFIFEVTYSIDRISVFSGNTDLCNAAPSFSSINLKIFISTLLLIIGVIKMIQSK
jgi:hypothetical protein